MVSIKWCILIAAITVVCLADKPSPTYKRQETTKVVISPVEAPKAQAREGTHAAAPAQVSYGAPAQPSYGAPAQPSYGAPAQPSYGAPAAESYGAPQAPAQESYGAPQAPAQDSYGAPQAPAQQPSYSAPSDVGTQGYYYYYYPVSTNSAPSKPSYAPPRQGYAGGSDPLAAYGIPIGVAIIVGIGIIIGIGILIAVASTTTTTVSSGRSITDFVTEHLDDVTDIAYNAIKLYSQMNSK